MMSIKFVKIGTCFRFYIALSGQFIFLFNSFFFFVDPRICAIIAFLLRTGRRCDRNIERSFRTAGSLLLLCQQGFLLKYKIDLMQPIIEKMNIMPYLLCAFYTRIGFKKHSILQAIAMKSTRTYRTQNYVCICY